MFDIHSTPAAAFTISVDGDEFRFTGINAECLRYAGMSADRVLGQSPDKVFAASTAEDLKAEYRRCATSRRASFYEIESVLPKGYACWRTTLIPIVSGDSGRVTALIGIIMDATAAKIIEQAKTAFHHKLSLAIGSLDGGFWTYNIATHEFETSRPLAELVAGPGTKPLNLAEYANYIHADDFPANVTIETECAFEYRVVTYAGQTRWLSVKRRRICDDSGLVTHMVGLVMDITDDKAKQHLLETEATTDDLTGLKNRRSLERLAAGMLENRRTESQPLSLIIVDLDGFKPVNDTYGHLAGDEILRRVARRLQRLVRPEDIVSRIGGDEFVIIIRGEPTALPDVVSRLSRAFGRRFQYKKNRIAVGASFGTAVQQPSDRTLADLMERADKALYAIKNERSLWRA